MSEKQDAEAVAAEKAEVCRQLTEANSELRASAVRLAEEATSAPDGLRRELEAQLEACRNDLQKAQDEIHAMHMSEQTQRVALLDELNNIQNDNSNLRAQLRALGKI